MSSQQQALDLFTNHAMYIMENAISAFDHYYEGYHEGGDISVEEQAYLDDLEEDANTWWDRFHQLEEYKV